MSYELIAALMFSTMMLMLLTGQRVFGAIGFVAVIAAFFLWGDRGGYDLGFAAAIKVMRWYPLLTLPMFIFMGYVLSESRIADDLYRMFHVWMGGLSGGLAIGTIGLMVLISAMNGLSVAGMAIGATIALPELLRRSYDKRMVTGVIQAGSSLGILVPPSVVLVLYAMIARQPVGQLWLAGVVPGLMMAALFVIYIAIRCRLNPALGPVMSAEERAEITWSEKIRLLGAGLLPLGIFAVMMVPFVNGWTSLVESSALGAIAAFLAAVLKRRMTWQVFETSVRQTLGITCMFMWIILAALAFGAVFDGLGAVKAIENLFTVQLGLNPWVILILMQLSFLVMGTFLDDTAMLVIVAPLYVPLVGALGFDLIWYGVLYTITCQIAYMTPPFGYNLFLMRAMAPPEITIGDIYRSIIPFVGVMAVALGLVMVFPEIALWLPGIVYGN
jgi:tripartite ATP-independent transporter DctM subunit